MTVEVIHIIDQLCREKGIDKDVLIEAIKSAVEAAARKKMPPEVILHSEFNLENGEIEIFAEKTVVSKVKDPDLEVSLKEASKISPEAQLKETILIPQKLENLGRIAAQLAKQVILQKVREAEIEIVYNEFQDKKNELLSGIVQRFEHGDIIVDLGRAEGVLPRREQVFREKFNRGDRVRAYVLEVKKTSKNTLLILSRTHVGLIKRLFELEVPEISEGMVEIMGIVREPNGRTKIAVRTNDRDIDAVGACVGMRGLRVQSIVQELRGEKIDIVEYSEDPEIFIRNALSPAKISRIVTNKEEKHMTIIVADDQMSLAIGKKGQNVRLAAKLVKWKIDIKGESEAQSILSATDLFVKKKEPQEDFIEIIKNTKGFSEKLVAILFANNVVTFDEVLSQGVEGLIKIQGVGPKKAEALVSFSEEYIKNRKPASSTEIVSPEIEDNLVYTAPDIKEKSEVDSLFSDSSEESSEEEPSLELDEEQIPQNELETLESEEESVVNSAEEAAQEEELEEDQEFGLEELTKVDSTIIKTLQENDFQTIAELSVTPIEELISIEGIDEDTAQFILSQAKLHMEKYENV